MKINLKQKEKYRKKNDEDKYDITVKKINDRGVTLEEIAELTYELQVQYIPQYITKELTLEHVKNVLRKREVQHAVLTGIELDVLAEKKLLSEPLLSLLVGDYGLYGVDESLAFSICNVYGSIGITNFGYVDKLKPGIIGKLDRDGKSDDRCNTFLDDIVGAIAAAAASSLAHRFAD